MCESTKRKNFMLNERLVSAKVFLRQLLWVESLHCFTNCNVFVLCKGSFVAVKVINGFHGLRDTIKKEKQTNRQHSKYIFSICSINSICFVFVLHLSHRLFCSYFFCFYFKRFLITYSTMQQFGKNLLNWNNKMRT